MKCLGVLPIRRGSKRFPEKNWKEFDGKPLWHWNFEKLLKCTGKVVVSSDAPEIAEKVTQHGADFILRSPELATDTANSTDVILSFLDNYPDYDLILLCQATTPNLSETSIKRVLGSMKDCTSIVTINSYTLKPTGGIYCIWKKELEKYKSFFIPGMGVYGPPQIECCDIDYDYDFYIAEAFKNKRVVV